MAQHLMNKQGVVEGSRTCLTLMVREQGMAERFLIWPEESLCMDWILLDQK
jgi:hypothetical protein